MRYWLRAERGFRVKSAPVKDDDSQPASAEPKATPAASAEPEAAPSAEPSAASTASEGSESKSAKPDESPAASDADSNRQESETAEKGVSEKDAAKAATAEKGSQESDAAPTPSKDPPESWRNTILWAVGIAAVLCVELFVYGHDGRIQVCVGVDTLTDYALRAEPRTKENAKKHPFCAERLNLGMWSSKDDLSQAALNDACTAAARIVGQEHRQKCLRKDEPWTRFVEKEHVMPWDSRLYRRLLWLD